MHWAYSVQHVRVQVLFSVLVSGQDVEGVAVDLNVASDGQVRQSQEIVVLVHVLVAALVQPLAANDASVLLLRLVDADAVIRQVEGDNETTVLILVDASVEASGESEDLAAVVHNLEEVDLLGLGLEAVLLTQGVLVVAEAVVGRHFARSGLRDRFLGNSTDREVVTVVLAVETLGEGVDARDLVHAAVGVDVGGRGDLVTGQVVVANLVLAWLVHREVVGELLAAQLHGEAITAVVGVVHLTDLDGVVGKVVVDDVRETITAVAEEAEDLAVLVKELLLGGNLAATEGLLLVLTHLGVLLQRLFLLRLLKVVTRRGLRLGEGSSLSLYKAFES